jgi:hypothetical protein
VAPQASIEQAVPLVRRALKVLADREVSPQLGLLKSTLLQLDSTFSERTYGAGSFRDFAQKLASAGHVVLREAGRNVLVELADSNGVEEQRSAPPPAHQSTHRRHDDKESHHEPAPSNGGRMEPRTADGIREVRRLFQAAQNPPRWPMYIRQAKQFLRNVDTSFDERKYGFASLVDLMRACQRDGLFRIERDRQGVMRLFPGNVMQPAEGDDDNRGNVVEPAPVAAPVAEWTPEQVQEPEVVDGDVVQEMNAPEAVVEVDAESAAAAAAPETAAVESRPVRRRGGRRAKPQGELPIEGDAVDTDAEPQHRAADRRGARKDAKAPKGRKTSPKRTPRARV